MVAPPQGKGCVVSDSQYIISSNPHKSTSAEGKLLLIVEGGLTVPGSGHGPKLSSEPLGRAGPFPGRQGGSRAGGPALAVRPVDTSLVSEQPVPICVPKAKMRLDFFFFLFKAVCALEEPHPSHLGLEDNCIGLINSFSFPSKVEAGAQGYKLNANPLWAPILWTTKTKSAAAGAAAAPHKTLGKHPEPAATQRAGRGATRANNVPAGRLPHPCRWTGGGWQGSKSTLKG